jgi:hypothetical protein
MLSDVFTYEFWTIEKAIICQLVFCYFCLLYFQANVSFLIKVLLTILRKFFYF